MMRYLTIHAGENAAMFAGVMMHLGIQSILLGSTLQTPQDDGEAFTALTTATQIEAVAKQLRREPVHMRMKGWEGTFYEEPEKVEDWQVAEWVRFLETLDVDHAKSRSVASGSLARAFFLLKRRARVPS
jgi:hypothetical protein